MRALSFLLLLASLLALAGPDPRPGILILGDANSTGFGFAQGWGEVLAARHPEWRVTTHASADRVLGDLLALGPDGRPALAATLDAFPESQAVLVFIGTRNASVDAYEKADAGAYQEQMAGVVALLREHANTKGATITLLTPVPAVDARLDRFSVTAYAGGEARSKALADAVRKVAATQGTPVIDAQALILADADARGPGKLLGSIGWRIRDWGIPLLTDMLEPEIVRVAKVAPKDAAAFGAWLAERKASRDLDRILVRHSGGVVAHGDALTAAVGAKPGTFDIPADLLAGDSLSLLFTADEKTWGMIATGGDTYAAHVLRIKYDDGRSVTVDLPAAAWQCLDEEKPSTPCDPFRFRFNAMKERFAMGVRNAEGRRIWGLVRFPLPASEGAKPVSAVAEFAPIGGVEENLGGGKRIALDGPVGGVKAFPVLAPDDGWDPVLATWATRDGDVGWTGGPRDQAALAADLRAFLATNPPASVAERARGMAALHPGG